MKNVRLFPYNPMSKAAEELAKALGIYRIKANGSKFVHGPTKTVINWGSSSYPTPEARRSRWLNPPENVALAVNKRTFFSTFKTPALVPNTTDIQQAIEWLRNKNTVVARKVLNGHSGEGIVLMDPNDPTSWDAAEGAPLFTLYIPKKMEFRLHVCDGKIFLVQKKILRPDVDPSSTNFKIRNLAAGFVFQRNDVKVPDKVTQAVLDFDKEQNKKFDFYAADVVYRENKDEAYILEINTAPGLTNSTVLDYTNTLKDYLKL